MAQKYGLLDYGSFLGFGGYFGIDYTAYNLKFYVDKIKELRGLSLSDADVKQLITPQLTARSSSVFAPASGVAVVSHEFGKAFGEAVKFYGELFGPRSESIGLRPNLITNHEEVRKIVAFFTWGFMIAMANYTKAFHICQAYWAPTSTSRWPHGSPSSCCSWSSCPLRGTSS